MTRNFRTLRARPISMVGFTVLELITAIGIVAILSALIIPAVFKVRQKLKDIQCGQNVRQIHAAILLYAGDHGDLYPTLTPPGWANQHDQLVFFSSYIPDYKFYRCPRSGGDTAPGEPHWEWWSTNMNGQVHWTEYKIHDLLSDAPDTGTMGQPLGSQRRPDKVVFVIDANDGNPRHDGRSNLCFQDGHVELMNFETYHNYGNAPEPGSPTGFPRNWWEWGCYSY